MKTMRGVLVLTATMLATVAADVTAQQGRRGHQMRGDRGRAGGIEMIMRMREQLELTDQQLQQLDGLRQTSVARQNAARAEMAELMSQLQAGQIQRSDVMAAMEARQEESEGIREAHREQIEGILTEAQRESLQELSARGRAFRAGAAAGMRRGARGAHGARGVRSNRGSRGGGIGMRGTQRSRDGGRPVMRRRGGFGGGQGPAFGRGRIEIGPA